ncbi:MAG: Fpg/Nei family DNA glycosylase [Pirellulaceae bacterium]|nr:Fpg/Nei family DNA glycosylase [Pirellulaceae bacterium]
MPEGDTIFRTAERLRQVLPHQTILAATARDPQFNASFLPGQEVADVESRGKHLLLHLDQGHTIHSHLGMTGSWHTYLPGEAWFKPRQRAALTLETATVVCVCFSPKTLELLSPTGLRRHPYLHRLGPDLLAETFDPAEAVRRFRMHDGVPLGEAVMNQSIVCGIGNVYKCEVLFLERLDPRTPVQALSDDQLRALVLRARQLLQANRHGYPRRTRSAADGTRLWVYGRSGRPCLACGQPVLVTRQGDLGRTTYWCARCQK